ncbi:hypothetical protein WR25_01761 [Diploscapter pachys]|uniref:BPTI/Kunitz inhibitor domain-containing protein n=1 Tax=Diploscapter pachys TaxID=2018661 RepID=A0A2A2JIL9_9BILA|nr:hypothetical protein WR25_01761 [Diploscapter pachys]
MQRALLVFTLMSAGSCLDICDYYRLIGKLDEHPECMKGLPAPQTTTPEPVRIGFCSSSAALIQCTADSQTCPLSGQVCIQSDGNKCCQIVTAGIPASEINAKAGQCPRPLGISVLQDTTIGCWMDSNCPGIQKCCVEPNPVTNSATRICRDPVGISSTNICSLPLAVGSCTAPGIRFYYDASSGRCSQFMYSGCGGNANNFQSLASCQATCGQSGRSPGFVKFGFFFQKPHLLCFVLNYSFWKCLQKFGMR